MDSLCAVVQHVCVCVYVYSIYDLYTCTDIVAVPGCSMTHIEPTCDTMVTYIQQQR